MTETKHQGRPHRWTKAVYTHPRYILARAAALAVGQPAPARRMNRVQARAWTTLHIAHRHVVTARGRGR